MKKMLILALFLAQNVLAEDNDGKRQVCIQNVSERANLYSAQGAKKGLISKAKRGLTELTSGLKNNEKECFNLAYGKKSTKISLWYEQDDQNAKKIKKIYELKPGTYKVGLKETKAGFVPFIQSQYPETEIGLEKAENKTKKMNRKRSTEEEAQADQD